MTKHEIILQLQRLAQDLSHSDTAPTAMEVLEMLGDRIDPTYPEVGEEDTINRVYCDSLIDALEALCEAGVVDVRVHPAFWPEWHAMFRRRSAAIKPEQKLLSVAVKIDEEMDQGHFHTIIGEMACRNPNCQAHGLLYRQWRHRLPENAMAPLPNLDPKLN